MRRLAQTLVALVVILAAVCPTVGAATGTTAPARAETVSAGPTDPREVETFFDNYLATQMSANHIAGATVSVVQDGQVLFAKGYGYADVAHRAPVDPDKTVFILGSLSKLFTWTAVMQLVEQGKLNLDADVNTYLDFKIPATLRQVQDNAYPEPITLNHLMAHNAGFEDNLLGQMRTPSEQAIPLGEWLKTHIPARVRPPGQFSAYANYGTALAGYIVERVSGQPYDDYIDKNLLAPLGMTRTTSRQPIPPALSADMSQMYLFANGEYQPQPGMNVVANVAPAGSFRSTAADMARFMIAHLNDGRYGEANILQPATAQLMHTQSFTHDPHVNGMAHGFWELDMNGQRIIGHAGSHFIFNSLLMLFPEQKLGVFIATNSQGGNAIVGANYIGFEQAFVDHYFSQNLPALTPPTDFAQRAAGFAGSYHFTMGRSDATPQKLMAMIMAVNVQADKDGLVATLPSGPARFVEVEPLVFRQVNGGDLVAFRKDSDGNITQAFLRSAPVTALIKNRWFETPAFNLTLLGLWFLLFLSFEIAAGVRLLTRRKNVRPDPATLLERAAHTVAGFAGFFGLLVLAGAFASIFNMYGLYVGNLPLWPYVQFLSVLVALLTLAMAAFTALAWLRSFWGVLGRVHYTLVTLGAVGLVWFMYFWNILGKGF